MDAMHFDEESGTNVRSPIGAPLVSQNDAERILRAQAKPDHIFYHDPAKCPACGKLHYGKTECPERRTKGVRIAIGLYRDSARTQVIDEFWDEEGALRSVRGSTAFGPLLSTCIITASIPLDAVPEIRGEVEVRRGE